MASLKKLTEYLFTGQFGRIASAVLERIPIWLFHRARAFIYETDPVTTDAPDLPDGYRCRPADESDLSALAEMTGLPESEYRRRFEAGEFCFGVFQGDRPANLNWVHRGTCYVRGAGFIWRAEPGHSYIYGIFTANSERGKGLYKKCLVHLANRLAADGSARLVQMVEDFNAPVLHTLPKLGYERTMTINHVRMFGIKYTKQVDHRDGRVQKRLFVGEPADLFPI
jgi:hypothetical protein